MKSFINLCFFLGLFAYNLFGTIAPVGNKENLVTPYPHWHYFDPAVTNYGMGTNPFYVAGPVSVTTDASGPNRGIGAATRQNMYVDGTGQLVFKYDMRGLGTQAWYVIQLDNNWKIEFSNDNINWTLGGTNTAPYDNDSTQESAWASKPYINKSPYYFDVSAFLPADYLYVRIGDASPANGWGGRAWNALITTKGYPYFLTGGNEPTAGGKWDGDQQWLFIKDGTSDREIYGRFADGNKKFVYKFDLPDDEDNCYLHTRVSGEFVLEVSTNSSFSTIDLTESNPVGTTTERFLQLSLKNVLSKTDDNVIYVRFRDNDPANGNGAWPKEFWISPHPAINKTISVFPCSEEELLYLWYDIGGSFEASRGFRYADGGNKFAYRFNFDATNAIVGFSLEQEFIVEGSSNNVDWVTLFRGDPTNSGQHYVLYNPFNGCALGYGAVAATNTVFCPNVYDDGVSNVFFIRIGDVDPGDGWGGLVRDFTVMIDPGDNLLTSDNSFALNEHIVSASVFHWYTPNAGQLSGPWRPRAGRDSWDGSPNWWKSQIKQMMLANIDVLYVLLIPEYELQRINLFRALFELRKEGYDVPKVVPFLDPIITWGIRSTADKYDLSQQVNKDRIINAYKRFFRQYYFVNTDDKADDYIGIINNKVVLDVWHVDRTFKNISSFTRSDLENALAAEFGAKHPVFNNGIRQITTKTGTTFSFADEKVAQFEVNDYANQTDFNGIRAFQLKGGYWDQNVRNPGTIMKRDGGVNYSNVWVTYPDPATVQRVYIESWNEFDEGSGIFAADPTQIYRVATNTSTDDWSAVDDPLEYIKTTMNGVRNFKNSEISAKDSTILWHNLPTNMMVSETKHCTVIVRNEGFDLWSSTNVINVPNAYYFGELDTDSQDFGPRRYSFDNLEEEADLYLGVFKGRTVVFNVDVTAPGVNGTYETHWRMLQESVAWFGEEITNTITVVPEPCYLLFIIYYLLFINRKLKT